MFQLRDYQVELAKIGCKILQELGIVYYNCEVRVGKSLMALECARLYGAKRVLFLTKLKAIASIKGDFEKLTPGYELVVINDESMHKVDGKFDLIIHDEHHRFSGVPKPGMYTKMFKEKFEHHPQIWLSGTMSPENFSMIFHQFWVSKKTPFSEPTFYKWARNGYVDVRQRVLPQGIVNDYSRGLQEKILPAIEPYVVRFTQEQAGFIVQLHEHFCHIPMDPLCKKIAERLIKTGVVEGNTGIISADAPAALLQKVHQIHSGTIILDDPEDGTPRRSIVLSDAKAKFIAETWPTEKLVIFYQFKAELMAIKQVLGDRITTELHEFQNSDKSCAFQIVSGREGINLSLGELIVFYNISHSATSYWQARDRLTTATRRESNIYWLFSGIEKEIYKVVQVKKNYTTAHFKKCLNQRSKVSL